MSPATKYVKEPRRPKRGPEVPDLGDLTDLSGVRTARARALSRMGIVRVRDLLLLVPRRLSTAGPRISRRRPAAD
jgi:hypothetical protein